MIRTAVLAPVMVFGATLALASAPAMAATTATKPAATRAVPARPAVPAKKVAVAKPAARAATPRGKSGLVTTTLANGKKVTYDCHLAGNKTKTACKGKG